MKSLVNYRGTDAVCKFLLQTGKPYFAIYQVGRGSKAVFRQLQKTNQTRAVDTFRQWAEVILEGDPDHDLLYELRVYDAIEDNEPNEAEEQVIKAGRQGLVVTFSLQTKESAATMGNYPAPVTVSSNSDELFEIKVENARLKMQMEYDRKVSDLERRLEELENDEGEDDSGSVGGMEGVLTQAIVPLIMQALNIKAPTGQTAINGIPATATETDMLNEAIMILREHDPDLPQNLMTLAEIAQTDPGQFQFLLGVLRKK